MAQTSVSTVYLLETDLYYTEDVERDRGCPGADSILCFLSGRVDAATRSSIERHVDECAACAILVLPAPSLPVEHRTRAYIFSEGEVVGGRYRIGKLLGSGGMGDVYAVLDQRLGEHVALKSVRASIADDARAIARLKSEVQLARRVTHPNVCRIYDLGFHACGNDREGEMAFLTMELLSGSTLAEKIRAGGPVALTDATAIARQLAGGLGAAHRAGVIHKDFKSENVMLVDDPDARAGSRAVITDFGLAVHGTVSAATVRNRVEFSGTPGYIAPERLLGGPATQASDIYSLGVVLFDMLEGRVPARPPTVSAGRRDLLGDLRSVASRCCDERPERRPTIGALEKMLDRLSATGPMRRPTTKLVLGAAAAALLLVATLGGRGQKAARGVDSPPPAPAVVQVDRGALLDRIQKVPAETAPTFEVMPPPRVAARKGQVRRSGAVPASPGSAQPAATATVEAHKDAPAMAPLVPSSRELDAPIRRLDPSLGAPGALTVERSGRALVDPFHAQR